MSFPATWWCRIKSAPKWNKRRDVAPLVSCLDPASFEHRRWSDPLSFAPNPKEATSNFTHTLKPLGDFTRHSSFVSGLRVLRWTWQEKEYACEGKHRSKRGAKNEAARQVLRFLIEEEARARAGPPGGLLGLMDACECMMCARVLLLSLALLSQASTLDPRQNGAVAQWAARPNLDASYGFFVGGHRSGNSWARVANVSFTRTEMNRD